MTDEKGWLIWSNEHDAWWKPDGWGYTKNIKEAGIFSLDEALLTVESANIDMKDSPKETMVREDAVRLW